MNIDDITTESEAMTALHTLRARFQWAGTMFNREDVDCLLQGEHEMDITDDIWDAVAWTWEWRKGLTEIITERGFEIISDAVSDVLSSGDYDDGDPT